MVSIFRKILNFILPPRCICCSKILGEQDGVCIDCFNKINFISKPFCKKCGIPLNIDKISQEKDLFCGKCIADKKPFFRMQRTAIFYDDFSKNIILAFKFLDKTENAKILSSFMYSAGKDIFNEGVDVIVPIPLHFKRLLSRKYNQSALLAKNLGKMSGIKVDYCSVNRIKNNKPQVNFSGRARISNVRNVFEVRNNKNIKGKRILLVDDVYTTGSTMKECAKTLRKAGAKSVDFITVART